MSPISSVWEKLQTCGYYPITRWYFMGKLCCVDYGFECDFAAETENDSELVEQFAKHTEEVHGIEYSKEALMQFIMRKYNSAKFEDAYMQVA